MTRVRYDGSFKCLVVDKTRKRTVFLVKRQWKLPAVFRHSAIVNRRIDVRRFRDRLIGGAFGVFRRAVYVSLDSIADF